MDFSASTPSRALRRRAAAMTLRRGRGRVLGAESMNAPARSAPPPSSSTFEPRRTAAAPRFRPLARTELAYLWVSLERLGVAPTRLEVATREALRALRRALPAADPTVPLRVVLFGCALRAARGHAKTLPLSLARVVPVDDSRARERDDAVADRRLPLLRALAAVPLVERAIFVLHELDGVSAPDVAVALSESAPAFHLRAADVRAKIAALAALLLRLRGAKISLGLVHDRTLAAPVAELFVQERYAAGPPGSVRQRLLDAIDSMRVQDEAELAGQSETSPAPVTTRRASSSAAA